MEMDSFSLAAVQSVLQWLDKSQKNALLECACTTNIVWGNEEPYQSIRRVSCRDEKMYQTFFGFAKYYKTHSTTRTVWTHIERDEYHPLRPFVLDLNSREKAQKLLEVIELSKNVYPLTMGIDISIKALGFSRRVEKALLKKGCTLADVIRQNNLPKVHNFDTEQEIHLALMNIGYVNITTIDDEELVLSDIS